MRKATRRTAPPVRPFPFELPTPIDRAVKSAAEKAGIVRDETRTVVAKLEKTVRAAATSARKTGETIAKDPRRFVEIAVRDAKSNLESVRSDVSREAVRFADVVARRLHAVVDPAMERALHRMNVPTQRDLRAVTTRVDALSRKMEHLHAPARRPRVRRTA